MDLDALEKVCGEQGGKIKLVYTVPVHHNPTGITMCNAKRERLRSHSIGGNQKGTAGRGRENKCHDNLRQTSRQFTTFYDNLRHFMTISVSFFH